MKTRVGIVGLGYVGLPLFVEFAKHYETIGYDINKRRIDELRSGHDRTKEIESDELHSKLRFTDVVNDLKDCDVYIVTVPTPIDRHNRPDLSIVESATKAIAAVVAKGNYIIYESTVYPGVTEEICVPIIEKHSGLAFNRDFFCGYSPERINPGDKEHRVTDIVKVTSGSSPDAAEFVDQLYAKVITAGTFRAASIKVAEAAKVIENSQRDLNIAFVNELAMIFNRLNIDTPDVLAAAATKWNFLGFKPGLVGGHCIGVDPYYLTHKAQETGYHPEIILAGRRLNDNMGIYVANQVVKLLIQKGLKVHGAHILVLGITFKENCPDIRNTKVVDLIGELREFGCAVDVFDDNCDPQELVEEYNLEATNLDPNQHYDAVIHAVAHNSFKSINLEHYKSQGSVIFDIKGTLPESVIDGRL